MSLEPFDKTFKMSSPSNSSSCTSESDLKNFTVDEVIGELSEFAPYDDSIRETVKCHCVRIRFEFLKPVIVMFYFQSLHLFA